MAGIGSSGFVWHALEHSRQLRERTRENSCRLATSWSEYTTTGWGEHVREDVFDFDCTFIEQPRFGSGYSINTDDDNPDLVDGRFPMGFAFVYEWRQDGKGFYTGAWCGFLVTTVMAQLYPTGTTDPDPGYVLTFDLSFTGNAIKDLPAHVVDF